MGALPALAGLSRRAESMLAGAVLLAMAILPVIEMAVRGFGGSGIPGAQSFVQHLTLWVAFLGAMLATREGRHLSLSTGLKIFPDRIQHYGDMLAAAASTAVSAGLFWASYMFVKSEYEFSMGAGGHWLPAWAMEAILPLAFLVMTLRLMFQPKDRAVRLAAFAGVALTIALIGLGMTGLFAQRNCSPGQREMAQKVLQSAGEVVWLEEEGLLDVVTAVSGSGPAYFFYLIEALRSSGERLGLPPDVAAKLALQTAHGSGAMAVQSRLDVADLRRQVTTPGGTTEAALRVLDDGRFTELMENAVAAATRRGRELGKGIKA